MNEKETIYIIIREEKDHLGTCDLLYATRDASEARGWLKGARFASKGKGLFKEKIEMFRPQIREVELNSSSEVKVDSPLGGISVIFPTQQIRDAIAG